MQKIKILTDSASDITRADEKKLGIKVMSLPVAVDGNSYRERIDFSANEFYQMMDNAKTVPAVSSLSVHEILDVYKELYNEGWTDVIYVTVSSTGSDTYRNALSAAQEFKGKVQSKDRLNMRIFVVDSKNYSGAYGYPVMQAALKAQKGATPDELLDFLHDCFENAEAHFLPLTLKYVRKSGLVTSASALFGELMRMRPVIRVAGGTTGITEKIRGEKNIIPGLLADAERSMEPESPYLVACGSNRVMAETLAKEMTDRFGYPPEYIVKMGAASACITGHDAIGFVIRRKHK
ncbi:DegV family protein [Porcipelethomonas sp.]|uniref:DegV family protein n=1 Tax=Porcipelethomonas sp. TaxID=2981675 RepID=UPI003EF27FD6